jgi:hypothetical protein
MRAEWRIPLKGHGGLVFQVILQPVCSDGMMHRHGSKILRPLPGVETELPRPKGVCKLLEIHGRLVAEVRDWKRCDARRNGEGGTVAARKKRGKEAEVTKGTSG